MSLPISRRAAGRAAHAAPVAFAAATNYVASHRPVDPGDDPTVCVRCGWSWPCARYEYAKALLDKASGEAADQ